MSALISRIIRWLVDKLHVFAHNQKGGGGGGGVSPRTKVCLNLSYPYTQSSSMEINSG